MQEKLARIIGHLQFDGWVANKKNARSFFYGNSNIELINEFIKDVKAVFNLESNIVKERSGALFRVYFHSVKIVHELNKITKFHSYTWFVPEFIINGNEEIKVYNYIVVRGVSMNHAGIEGIREILRSLDIESNVRKFQNGRTAFSSNDKYVLTITIFDNIRKFHGKIKLTSKKERYHIG